MLSIKMNPELELLAKKYVWWKSPAWAIVHPDIFLCNIMNLGNWDDICLIRKLVGDEILKESLMKAPIGAFSYRSWDYWHHKFDLLPIPPLPERKFL